MFPDSSGLETLTFRSWSNYFKEERTFQASFFFGKLKLAEVQFPIDNCRLVSHSN